jgi:probable rRNA maturation factor
MSKRCEIAIVNQSGRKPELDLAKIQAVIDAALAGDRVENAALTVLLVDDAESSRLHREHFSDPDPTDVMTFPDGSADPESGRTLLGDLAVGADVARRVAQERGRCEADEVCLYVLHGLLHLLGYDDEDERDASEMWDVQRRLLARVGIELEPFPS